MTSPTRPGRMAPWRVTRPTQPIGEAGRLISAKVARLRRRRAPGSSAPARGPRRAPGPSAPSRAARGCARSTRGRRCARNAAEPAEVRRGVLRRDRRDGHAEPAADRLGDRRAAARPPRRRRAGPSRPARTPARGGRGARRRAGAPRASGWRRRRRSRRRPRSRATPTSVATKPWSPSPCTVGASRRLDGADARAGERERQRARRACAARPPAVGVGRVVLGHEAARCVSPASPEAITNGRSEPASASPSVSMARPVRGGGAGEVAREGASCLNARWMTPSDAAAAVAQPVEVVEVPRSASAPAAASAAAEASERASPMTGGRRR